MFACWFGANVTYFLLYLMYFTLTSSIWFLHITHFTFDLTSLFYFSDFTFYFTYFILPTLKCWCTGYRVRVI